MADEGASGARPTCLGSRVGITEDVLAPWTPVRVERKGEVIRVACTGPAYEFGRRPFPRAITAAGKPILAGPIRIAAQADGRPQVWKGVAPRVVEVTPGRARLSQRVESADLVITADTAVEFDGMALTDWKVEVKRALKLERFIFEIPYAADAASLIYYYPHYERSWSEHAPGALTPEGFADDFRPVMWLGNEERGLEWFAETDENWFSGDPSRVTEVRREAGGVVLRLNIITTPVELSPQGRPSLAYQFGLQATPVNQPQKDAWDYRIFHVSQGTFGEDTRLDIPESSLDELKAAGVRAMAFHEHWTDVESYTKTTYGAQLRRLADECHKRGMQLLIYFGFLISDLAPEWQQWGDDCVLEPRHGYTPYKYPPQPVQNAYIVCYRSAWQDFLADGIAQAMDTYGVDGVYLDGTADPFEGCMNRRHGCGYVRADGTARPTYAILPIRSMMRRIYAIVKQRHADGQVNVHQSNYMVMPGLSWATSYWDGEQLSQRPSLERFRVELMGHQWGVPAEFLAQTPFRPAVGLALLHDVPVRAVRTGDDLKLNSALWHVFDEFRRKEAEFLPYWRNAEYLSVEPSDFVVSMYRHPRNGLLIEILNNGAEEHTGQVMLNYGALGMSGPVSAVDALTGEPFAADGKRLSVTLAPLEWRLIWLMGGVVAR